MNNTEQSFIENEIDKALSIKKEEFLRNYKNTCEACSSKPSGKFCSRECYYKSVYNYKLDYFNLVPEIASKHFGIKDEQKREFKTFCEKLMNLYY